LRHADQRIPTMAQLPEPSGQGCDEGCDV